MKTIFIAFLCMACSVASAQRVTKQHGGTAPWSSSDSLKVLQSKGVLAPVWATTASLGVITTPISIANGGTNSSTALSGSTIMVSDGTHVVQGTAGTNNQILKGNTGSAPTWTTLNALLIVLSDTTGNTGKKLTVKAGGGFDWE